jgi:hypothetical protein
VLNHFKTTFFNQLIFDTPLLRHFISHTEIIKAHYRATVAFHGHRVEVGISPQEGAVVNEGVFLGISCKPSDWQLSSLAQVCTSSLPPLDTLEHLEILSHRSHRQDDIEITQWLELLNPFASVKNLVLSRVSVLLVAPVLQELAGERITEVLPMLQNIRSEEPRPSRHHDIKDAIQQFIAVRQLSGHLVAVHYEVRLSARN